MYLQFGASLGSKLQTKKQTGTNRCFECLQSTHASGDFYGLQAIDQQYEEMSGHQPGGQTKVTYYLISREIHLSCQKLIAEQASKPFPTNYIPILNSEICTLANQSDV